MAAPSCLPARLDLLPQSILTSPILCLYVSYYHHEHLLVLLNSAWIMSRGEQTGHEYAMSLLAILSSVTDERVLTYTITLVDELLDCECTLGCAHA